MSHENKGEYISAITHTIGFALSIAALVLLIVYASIWGDAMHVVGFSIFGTSLVSLYAASSVFHFFPKNSKAKHVLQRLDHAMIFFLIAGTYTPICLSMPQRAWGWTMFGIIWFLAALGFTIKITGMKINSYISTLIYITTGWLILIALNPILQWLSIDGFMWLIIGGISYTLGCVFYLMEKHYKNNRWFSMHDIFHLFVMAGSISHFYLMFRYVLHS